MIPLRHKRARAPLFRSAVAGAGLFAALASVPLAPTGASAAATDRLASKSITQVHVVQTTVFALAEDGQSFSWLNLFVPSDSSAKVRTVDWPWDGAIEGGAPWRLSMLLNANYASSASDSLRVVRLAAARSAAILGDAPLPLRGDSLVFKDTTLVTAGGAALTALAVKGDTALLGFGRLGLAYARLNATETANTLVADSTVSFRGLPSVDSNSVPLITCRWNRSCRSDTVTVPAGGLDSVISIALDTTAGGPWILIATQKGLRRGPWRGTSFPYVTLPGISDTAPEPVRSVFVSPSTPRAWVFTGRKVFYSDDHGASFRVPQASPQAPTFSISRLTNYSTTRAPQVGFAGDTSFINFNMDSVGVARFGHDTLQVNSVGMDIDQVLINANDSLDVSSEEALTGVAVAKNGGASVLVLGTARQGIFYRRLDLPAKTFVNLTSRAALKSGLGEVITYPTLFEGPASATSPYVRIGYRLKKSGKVTITIYNYAMEKVRVVVRNAPRQGGVPRSESFADDRWDGRDSSGRLVSVGTYYIRVESDQGEAAFGKVICVGGRR